MRRSCLPSVALAKEGKPCTCLWRGVGVVYLAGLENRASLRTRGFESHPLRQLGNGSPATRARQPFFGEISSRFEFSIKFEPTFLRNARICVLSPCDKRILAWLLNKMTSRIGSSQLFPFCSKSLISCSISAFSFKSLAFLV